MLSPIERRALFLSVFTAACICFAPAQIVSGVALLLLSALLYRWDQALLRKEAAAEEAAAGDPSAEQAEPPHRAA